MDVEQVAMLAPDEKLALDAERLHELYRQLGTALAEDMVCRALEELAHRIGHADQLHMEGRHAELRKCVRTLGAIAAEIGLGGLARVAASVVQCLDDGDAVAVSATLARLTRVGERSLFAIWDMQDLSV